MLRKVWPTVEYALTLISEGRFDEIVRSARSSRLSPQEISDAISAYGRQLLRPSKEVLERTEAGETQDDPKVIWLDVPFYTEEEGLSDLELRINVHLDRPNRHLGEGIYDFDLLDVLVP